MPMHHLTQRISLVACDTCDAVMTLGGATAEKRYRESDPTDLAAHYATPAELRATARTSGWNEDDGQWTCPRCSHPPAS